MREIDADGFTMRIYNEGRRVKLAPQFLAVVPYENGGESRIHVVQGFVVPMVKLSKNGEYGHGLAVATYTEKDILGKSPEDVERQIAVYRWLLKNTNGQNPISIVLPWPQIYSPQEIVTPLSIAYKDAYREDHSEHLERTKRRAIKENMLAIFDPSRDDGARRIREDRTVTLYFGLPRDVLQYVTQERIPNIHSLVGGRIKR